MQSEVYCVLAVSDFSLWVYTAGVESVLCIVSAGVMEIIARERSINSCVCI